MATPDSTRETHIPPELLEMIFQHNSKTDLQNIRLACRRFKEVATPFLDDELTLRLDVTEQEMAQRPASTFSRYVKVLRLLIVCFDKKKFADYAKATRKRCKYHKVAYDEHLAKQSYERYNSLRDGHTFALTSGLIGAYVTSLLAHMPRLDCILISDGLCRPPPSELTDQQAMDYSCLPYHHHPYAVVPGSGLNQETASVYWDLLTRAFSASKTHFTKFSVDSSLLDHGLRPAVLNIEGSRLEPTVSFVANLTTLQLELNYKRSTRADRLALAHVLAQATKLEALSLSVISYPAANISEVLQTCEYPKLRICMLNWFQSNGKQLLRFLSVPERLTHLRLGRHELIDDYTWQELVPMLKARLPFLQAISMTDREGWWINDLIQDYFFRGGPNPFKDDSIDSGLEESWREKKKKEIASATKKDEGNEDDEDDEEDECDDDSEDESRDDSEDDWTGMTQYLRYAPQKPCDCSKCASASKP
ncbi:MAG: hypothetical protein L6R42_004766 [Xanthoria sp. 1 TBL-2021]|nr:MAG: hypothetical protein L6R42_004766 [Xanthoria sp. 1 TBL-2021]